MMDFIDNGYWLWTACWKYSQMHRFENMMEAMMSGGGESMMMATPIMSSMSVESVAVEPEPSEEEQLATLVMGIHAIIAEIDKSIFEGHENSENLYEAVDFLEEVLLDLKADYSTEKDLK